MVWSSGSARFTLDDSKLQAGGLRIGTSDHSGILDSAVSGMHASEPGLHLELAVLLRPVSARTFRQQPYISSADPESMLAPTPVTYQTDRTLTPAAWERGGPQCWKPGIRVADRKGQQQQAVRAGTAAGGPGTGTGGNHGRSAWPRPGSGGLPRENGAERADEAGTGRGAVPCHSSPARAAAHCPGPAAPAER